MLTTEDYEKYEDAEGNKIYGKEPTEKEKKESNSFVAGFKKALESGSTVEVEAFHHREKLRFMKMMQ